MSSNDSVNMVYKFMLRGATDFLVKPVGKNELQNLWHHVWRCQAQKAEGLSDNELPINMSDGACTPENEECNEKGNDTQSSCSAPDLEAESALKSNKVVASNNESDADECVKGDSSVLKHAHVVTESSLEAREEAVMMIRQADPCVENVNTAAKASDNNDASIFGSREAIELMENFQDHSTKTCVLVITCSTKFDRCPQLDLSLIRRYDESQSQQDAIVYERRHAVNQSNVSAVARYKSLQPSHHTLADTCHQSREFETSANKNKEKPTRAGSVKFS